MVSYIISLWLNLCGWAPLTWKSFQQNLLGFNKIWRSYRLNGALVWNCIFSRENNKLHDWGTFWVSVNIGAFDLMKIGIAVLLQPTLTRMVTLLWLLQQWMEKAPDGNLHLPVPNMFVPTDLSIKTVLNKVLLTTKPHFTRFHRTKFLKCFALRYRWVFQCC